MGVFQNSTFQEVIRKAKDPQDPVSYEESNMDPPCCKVQRSDYWEELASRLANT